MILAERITRHYFPLSSTDEYEYECGFCDNPHDTEEEAEDCCAYEYACDFCGEIYEAVPGFSRGDIERAAENCCSYECSHCMEVYHASRDIPLEAAQQAAEDCCDVGAARPAFQ